MFGLELLSQTVNVLYHAAKGFPFATYGENVLQGVPNVLIWFLFDEYEPDPSAPQDVAARRKQQMVLAAIYASVAFILYRTYKAYPYLLDTLQALTIPIYVSSRVMQIYRNYSTGSTGQLSAISTAALGSSKLCVMLAY